ncbi:hypothetical protein PTTG_25229 [Puccinia triticina 1-1 BBBD Race 1]|uniref:Uncharacterized protein n=1 Tax=Puccinia triticina (isolate 1-1 / race 1 (BBBD)) TaxID=630390 RepID=A0A180H5C8_PUCT1|nr:hypothetical protein PTTG_25229 [Puccinia triticina 1-1 BBBD Race 1]
MEGRRFDWKVGDVLGRPWIAIYRDSDHQKLIITLNPSHLLIPAYQTCDNHPAFNCRYSRQGSVCICLNDARSRTGEQSHSVTPRGSPACFTETRATARRFAPTALLFRAEVRRLYHNRVKFVKSDQADVPPQCLSSNLHWLVQRSRVQTQIVRFDLILTQDLKISSKCSTEGSYCSTERAPQNLINSYPVKQATPTGIVTTKVM